MQRTPKVVEITEEEDGEPKETEMHAVEVEQTPTQICLKKLTKQKTKYNRQLLSCQSEEDKVRIQQLIDGINDMRFILKLSNTNKNLINKVLYYVEYPDTIQQIQESVIHKIETEEI